MKGGERYVHVLLVAPANSIHSRRLAQMYLDEGFRVTYCDYQDPGLPASDRYRFVPYPTARGIYRLPRTARHWVRAALIRRTWRRLRPDVVNIQWVDTKAVEWARAGVHPLVLGCWGSDINNHFVAPPVFAPEHGQQIGSALSRAAVVTADTQEVLLRCERLAGRKLDGRVIYYGIDTALFRPGYEQEAIGQRQRLGIPPDAKVVLSPRRLVPKLGHHHILDAFAELVKGYRAHPLILAFRRHQNFSQEYVAHLCARAEELGVASSVHWLSEVPYAELPVYYAMADIVVNYPEQDAFPVTLFEAAACRRVVVSCSLPAYEGVFGDSLVMVPPRDSQALAAALRRCLAEAPEQAAIRLDAALAISRAVGSQERTRQAIREVFASCAKAGKAA